MKIQNGGIGETIKALLGLFDEIEIDKRLLREDSRRFTFRTFRKSKRDKYKFDQIRRIRDFEVF